MSRYNTFLILQAAALQEQSAPLYLLTHVI